MSFSKLIEVPEELSDSNSLLLAGLSKFGNNIFDIFGLIFLDINSSYSGNIFGVIVEGVVVTSADSKQLL